MSQFAKPGVFTPSHQDSNRSFQELEQAMYDLAKLELQLIIPVTQELIRRVDIEHQYWLTTLADLEQ